MMRILLIIMALLFTSINAQADSGVYVSDVVVREMLPGVDSTAGYFSILNHTDNTVTLMAATSELSGRIEIHEHVMTAGMMKMQQVKTGIEIKPHERLTFQPGGYHLMIFKDKTPIKKGTHFKLTLLMLDKQEVSGTGKVVSVLDMQQQTEHQHHH